MARARSAQVHVVVVQREADGKTWAIGTPAQRGFTEVGALKASAELGRRLPRGWSLTTIEITPIDEVIDPCPSG